MADGDRLHQSLPLGYQQPFRQLCEGFVQLDEQARNLAKRVKRDLERCHPHIATSFAAVAQRLAVLSEVAARRTEIIDPRVETQNLKNLAASCSKKHERGLLLEAAQSMVNDMAEGQVPVQIPETLGRKFADRLYQAHFGDVVLSPPAEDTGLPAPTRQDLDEIQSLIRPNLDALGGQFSQANEAEKPRLRLQPRPRKLSRIDDLDVDITDVFNKE